MATVNYCRREIGGKFCMKPITQVNALDWCASCRERLPLWPLNPQEMKDIKHDPLAGLL